MITIQLPAQLAAMAEGRRTLEVGGATLGEVLEAMDQVAPMLRSQIFDGSGRIRQFVGLFVDDRQVSWPVDGAYPVRSGGRVSVVMAVAGG